MAYETLLAVIIGGFVIVGILLLGPYVATVTEVDPAFIQFMNDSNEKCSACLSQFHDFNCTPSNRSSVCHAIKYEYCLSNCTIELQSRY
jgi:hypothetical protein